jgi:hypothetical protein
MKMQPALERASLEPQTPSRASSEPVYDGHPQRAAYFVATGKATTRSQTSWCSVRTVDATLRTFMPDRRPRSFGATAYVYRGLSPTTT